MRRRAVPVLGAFALLLVTSACGGASVSGTASPGIDLPPGSSQSGSASQPVESEPAPSDASAEPTSAASPSADATRVVILHGTFTGLSSTPLASADQRVEVEVRWNVGPDDVHDRDAFTLTSGTFTFSEAIDGVCGGSRIEAGSMTSFVNAQSLSAADPQVRDNAQVTVIDQRLNQSGVEFVASSLYEVPNADPEGCGDLDRSGVGPCALVFLQTAIGTLQEEATCTGPAGEWTGTLVP